MQPTTFQSTTNNNNTMTTTTGSGNRYGSTCGRHGYDPAPQIRPAGIVGQRDCGIFDSNDRPPTPDHVKPFRKSAMTTVGRTIHHYGTRNDPPRDEEVRYGKKGNYSETAEDCLRPAVVDKMGALAAEHAERRYLSSKREPLGKGPDPTVPIPEHLVRNGFGMATRSSESAKNVIYACGDKEAPELYPPGAQRDRKYDWAKVGVDPTKHRFGFVPPGSSDHTKELLNPTEPPTVMLPKLVKDYNSITQCQLGHSRNLGSGCNPDPNHVYGKAGKTDVVGVKGLLSSHGTPDDGEYERSVGHATIRSHTLRKLHEADKASNSRSSSMMGGSGTDGRIFGVPTVRLDLPRPTHRKVTNSNNYGDDVGAGALLYPNRYITKGIDEMYFTQPLTLDGIRQVVAQTNMDLSDEAIVKAFNACQINGVTSIETFKDACYDLAL